MIKTKASTFEITTIVVLSLFSIGLFLSVLKVFDIINLSWLVCTSPIWIPSISLVIGGLYILIALHHHDLVVIKVGEETKTKSKNGNKTTSKRTSKTTRRVSKKDQADKIAE